MSKTQVVLFSMALDALIIMMWAVDSRWLACAYFIFAVVMFEKRMDRFVKAS